MRNGVSEGARRRFWLPLLAAFLVISLCGQRSAAQERPPCVILLHGITKDASSMKDIELALQNAGYHTVNLEYDSRKFPIETLAVETIPRGLAACRQADAAPLHFVAHSMGGLILRWYYEGRDATEVASAVMLGTPNQGSRLGNFLSCIPLIKDLNGPAGKQMGVDANSVPSRLGPVHFPLGVIAGTRTINPLFAAIIDGDDDGRVGLPSTYVEGVCARVTYPVSHDNLTSDGRVIAQVLNFLDSGRFAGDDVEYFSCKHPAARAESNSGD